MVMVMVRVRVKIRPWNFRGLLASINFGCELKVKCAQVYPIFQEIKDGCV